LLLGALAALLCASLWFGLRGRASEDSPDSADPAADPAARARVDRSSASDRASAEPTQASGQIHSADGKPIPDAVVTLAALEAADQRPISVRSDESGDWSIPDVEPGRYALSATAAGFLAGLRPELTLRSGANPGLDLRLETGGNLLSGVVSDATGGVIEGALVQVTPQSGILSMRERDSSFTLTDADGRYALQLADGRHRVRASHLDYASEQVVLELAGAAARRDFSLVPTAVVEGIVRRESDGQAVAYAEVSWSRERDQILPGRTRHQCGRGSAHGKP
jgi:hypothetical protein